MNWKSKMKNYPTQSFFITRKCFSLLLPENFHHHLKVIIYSREELIKKWKTALWSILATSLNHGNSNYNIRPTNSIYGWQYQYIKSELFRPFTFIYRNWYNYMWCYIKKVLLISRKSKMRTLFLLAVACIAIQYVSALSRGKTG